jgi:hypothetical protein
MWWQGEKSLPLPGIETIIQNTASCYNDGAITVQNENSSVTLDFRVYLHHFLKMLSNL